MGMFCSGHILNVDGGPPEDFSVKIRMATMAKELGQADGRRAQMMQVL
jgi:hypothetical protein